MESSEALTTAQVSVADPPAVIEDGNAEK